ncbi:hypothetical protein MZM54_29545 [[Brevibacterium] frigoritolerans]|nr:hypothetical protein [Peribacillus frigoritolerans]
MNILNEVKKAQEEVWYSAKMIDKNKFDLMENILAAGFVHEGNTYLGLYEELEGSLKQPVKKRNPMFKDVDDWTSSLKYYIELLKEEKKFYETIYYKQQGGL